MVYLLLAVAIALELIAAALLKLSAGFTQPLPSLLSLLSYLGSVILFAKILEKMNLGVAYATWAGVGIVASALISALFFKEELTAAGVAGIVLIVAGCVLLNLYGTAR